MANVPIALPYLMQTIALGEPDGQGNRVLVISEPPPTLPRDGIPDALASIFGRSSRQKKDSQDMAFHQWGDNSRLYLTQYRTYDHVSGRWLPRDLLGEATDMHMNVYASVEGDSIGNI